MGKLIDADYLKTKGLKASRVYHDGQTMVIPLVDVIRSIDQMPEADAEMIRPAHWIERETPIYQVDKDGLYVNSIPKKYYRCSSCGRGTVVKTLYCTCGSKMIDPDPEAVPLPSEYLSDTLPISEPETNAEGSI